MENVKSIYERLATVQANLNAPKNLYNKFGKFYYRSAESILEGVKPLLKDAELILTISDEIVEINGFSYIKATARVTDYEGNTVETTAYAKEELDKKGMDSSQITGSCSSYARKYALNGLFAIDDTKDSDATNKYGKDDEKATKEQIAELRELQVNELNLCKNYKVSKLEDLTEEQAEEAIKIKRDSL